MAEKQNQDVELSTKGVGSKKIIILIIIGLVLIGGSIAATIFITGGSDSGSTTNDSDTTSSKSIKAVLKPSLYLELEPDFVINFESGNYAKFLSVQIQAMARQQTPLDILQKHMPVIRNDILLLLSSQKYDVVRTSEGKIKLQSDILTILQNIISNESHSDHEKDKKNEVHTIEAVYFTSFIMQ